MKRLILILLILMSFKTELYSQIPNDYIYSYMACMTSGVQADFSNDMDNLTYSFDNNITLFLLNIGFNYKFGHNTTCFVGLGLGTLIQFQYGFPVIGKDNLFRIRTDIPLMFYFEDKSSFLNYTHIGFYYVNSENGIHFNENYGITFSINFKRAIDKLKEE